MNLRRLLILPIILIMTSSIALSAPAAGQQDALASITAEELRTHLTFIASDEMMGRDTPSPQLKLAARYLATMVESYGWKPILPDGSFLQTIALETVSPSTSGTRLTAGGETFRFPADFGGRLSEGTTTGEMVFIGLGLEQPDSGWDDYAGIDVSGKIVVILSAPSEVPEDFPLAQRRLRSNTFLPFQKDAAAVIAIVNAADEQRMAENGESFTVTTSTRWPGSGGSGARMSSRVTIQVRHHVAAALLGVSGSDISAMFASLRRGERVPGRALSGDQAELTVAMDRRAEHTQNVVAYLKGTDPVLKNEYVLFGCHYDHVGFRNGQVYNGADDDGSGTVAMLEIAQAMMIQRPKRSVILVWHTGEEKGLRGAGYFVDNSPVPLENISAQLQMDMLSRNDPESLYIIGSHFLSSEMDAIDRQVADRLGIIKVDDEYNDPDRRDNYFRQSDHHAYHQVGIPVTFFFTGVHDDLHQPTDDVENCDFDKMERAAKYIYAVGLEVGNYPHLLRLDRDPEVTQRGKGGGG